MGLRVIQWATGSVGVAAIKGVLEHPDRRALRERDPRDLCRTGGHSELLRPAPHHRPGGTRVGALI
jgi:hypothetical protein